MSNEDTTVDALTFSLDDYIPILHRQTSLFPNEDPSSDRPLLLECPNGKVIHLSLVEKEIIELIDSKRSVPEICITHMELSGLPTRKRVLDLDWAGVFRTLPEHVQSVLGRRKTCCFSVRCCAPWSLRT